MVLGSSPQGIMELFISRGQVVAFNSRDTMEKNYSHKPHSMGYLLPFLFGLQGYRILGNLLAGVFEMTEITKVIW